MKNNRLFGARGEYWAARFLQEKGYKILEKNFRNKLGEVDLIVKDKGTVCFVEVKVRMSTAFGMPFEAVHYRKQKKLAQLAQSYLKFKFHTVNIFSRFDVISILIDGDNKPCITHIPNAFDLSA